MDIAGLITDPPYVNYQYVYDAGFAHPFDAVLDGEWWTSVTGWYGRWLPTVVSHLRGPAFLFLDTRYLPVLLRMIHLCRWSAVDYYQLSSDELVMQCGGEQAGRAEREYLVDLLREQNAYGQNKAPAMLDALVARVPKRPGVILDPFMGGGSTLIAGLRAGWSVVGIEKDEATCARAVDALQEVR